MLKYEMPTSWVKLDATRVSERLGRVRTALQALARHFELQNRPYEVLASTLRPDARIPWFVERMSFAECAMGASMVSQTSRVETAARRQAATARTYRWIAELPPSRPLDANLVCRLHGMLVTGSDDDHCPPGVLRRGPGPTVYGFSPLHLRYAPQGEVLSRAFAGLCRALSIDFQTLDPLIRGIVLHYHILTIHPFDDGNHRLAQTLEALLLQRAGLPGSLIVAVSNYYYGNRLAYESAVTDTLAGGHDLTPILLFGLGAMETQCARLLEQTEDRT